MNRAIAFLAVALVLPGAAQAIVNPNFTPRHLVDQSDLVVAGTVKKGEKPTEWKIAVTETMRGRAVKEIVLDLSKCDRKFAAVIARDLAGNVNKPVVLYSVKGQQGKQSFVHVAGYYWLKAEADKKGRRFITGHAPQMVATFAGGTDKLIAMTRHLTAHPDQRVPVSAGFGWRGHVNLGPVKSDVAGLAGMEIGGRRGTCLFVGADEGDRLFTRKGRNAMEETTAASKLDTKSKRFAWLDVNADGLADLVSFDGGSIMVRLNGKDGVFADAGSGFVRKLRGPCLGLTPCSANDGRPGVLVSTDSTPLLLIAGAKGWTDVKLPDPSGDIELGERSACVAADLDRDGCADILQPGETGSLLWKGKSGGFGRPVKSGVVTHGGQAKAVVGDFDEDGHLDVFLPGTKRNGLWENDGKGGFKDVFIFAGALSYKCPPQAADTHAMDLNHDGRADICVVYDSSDIMYYINRGFRAFIESGEVRLLGLPDRPGEPRIGQKALGVGDFNADGSDDLAAVLTTGELQVYFNDKMDLPVLNLRLPKGVTGPVTAACTMGDEAPYFTGVASVAGHSPATRLSLRQPGRVTVTYRYPGGPERTIKLTVENKARDVVLEDKPPPERGG